MHVQEGSGPLSLKKLESIVNTAHSDTRSEGRVVAVEPGARYVDGTNAPLLVLGQTAIGSLMTMHLAAFSAAGEEEGVIKVNQDAFFTR